MSIQEAWETHRRAFRRVATVAILAENPSDLDDAEGATEDAARSLALVSHVDACRIATNGSGDEYLVCGHGNWYCDKAQEIERLGKEGNK